MDAGYIVLIILVVIILLLVFFGVNVYNQLTQGRNKIKNSWSQIEVQLKRRFDLIPNLVETAKGYMKHEDKIFSEFAKARDVYNKISENGSPKELSEVNNMFSGTLSRLIAVSEAYPELKADKNFSNIMENLKETEDKISFTRQFYNDVVLNYQNAKSVFPNNIIAKMFSFKDEEYFKADEQETKNIKISF